MSFTRQAIEKNRVTLVILICLGLAGYMAYTTMPRSEDPGFLIRVATIITPFPGASPERVDELVTDPIEEAVRELPELDFVSSTSSAGLSIVTVNLKESYRVLQPIWDKMRRKIDAVKLPEGARPPEINDEFGDVFGIVIALTGEGFSAAELEDVAKDIRNEVLLLKDTGKVELYGLQQERIFVEFDHARLQRMGLTPGRITQTLRARNIVSSGGELRTDNEVITLEPSGNFDSVEELKQTVVALPTGGTVYLGDIVDIRRDYIDPRQVKVTSAGTPAIGIGVSLRDGGNIIRQGTQVRALLTRLEEAYPIGLEFDLISYLPDTVDRKVDDFISSLFQAVGVVLAVMLLTLGLRTGFLVATLIPVTIVITFFVMSVFDIGIDQISLAALIIALGMLVDNAIVMSEAVLVQVERGVPRMEATLAAAAELRVPLLVSSLTTSAAFLPIFLAESAVGEYTASLFKVVTIALLVSWALSMTMIPMLCARFIKAGKQKNEDEVFNGRFYTMYRGFLTAVLRHRFISSVLVVAAFMGGMYSFGFVRQLFFPDDKVPIFTAQFEFPKGTPLERTERLVKELNAHIRSDLQVNEERKEGIVSWGAFLGGGEPRFRLGYAPKQREPGYALVILNTSSPEVVPEMITKLREFSATLDPDVLPTVKKLASGPAVSFPVEIRLFGKDAETLFSMADELKEQLRGIDGTEGIEDNWGPWNKKIAVEVDQARALRAQVTHQDIASSLETLLTGVKATDFREGEKIIPVTLRAASTNRKDAGGLDSLNVFPSNGAVSVPLKQVADLDLMWEPGKILRRDGLKAVTVRCQLAPGITAREVTNAIQPFLNEYDFPVGYSYELGGENEASDEANQSIADKLPFAFFIILVLLVGQFNSIRKTIIVLSTIPLGLIGVGLGLNIANSYFGFMTFLGIISLAGIVINNAIVLLERIKLEIEAGYSPQDAVVRAAQLRARPILLTTATTVTGLLPLLLAGAPMFEPMAIVIIFGLLFSTMLTLGVVPLVYSVLFRVRFS